MKNRTIISLFAFMLAAVAGYGASFLVTRVATLTNKPVHRTYLAAPVAPMSPIMDWDLACPSGGMVLLDSATITNFDTDLVTNKTSRYTIDIGDVGGTTVLFRVKYPAAMAAGSAVTIAVAGGGTNDQWDRLLTVTSSARSLTITTKSTDCGDGTWKWTDVDCKIHGFDLKGCRYFIVGIEAIQTGTGASTATLEFKVI